MPNKDERSQLIDVREDDLQTCLHVPAAKAEPSPTVLDTLLRDHATGRNIFWATHDYEAMGPEYDYHSEMLPRLITGEHGTVIRPRVLKTKEQQTDRVRDMAEVFTPAWVVKKMVEYVDIEVHTRTLELTCGEAPFLVSRYDATTGSPIAVGERAGVLDHKIHLINHQQLNDEEWLVQVRQAFQSTYGYEWQGDSLLLARENLLYTFVDYYEARFGCKPTTVLLQEFAEIISWNLWQMDGLTYRLPQEKTEEQPQEQLSLFNEAPAAPPAPLCVIMDWQKGEILKVNDIKTRLTKHQDIMKFDVIIGNPPYQEEIEGSSDSAIYNYFMDEGYKMGRIVEYITPARFLFKAGKTPKEWNKKMLNDPHFKVLFHEQDSSKVFSNTDIKGGVAITYRDETEYYGAIVEFSPFSELQTINQKVAPTLNGKDLSIIMYLQNRFDLEALYSDYPDFKNIISSNGKERRIVSSSFEKLSVFHDVKDTDDLQILGIIDNNRREYKYIAKKYVLDNGNLNRYKVVIPKSNGSGAIGEVLSTPLICAPLIGYTQSFIGIGAFDTQSEAEACLKYIKTKFCRAMLGILKITQDNPPGKWRFVPLQDFTPSSDIDWSKTVAEIDEQLFDKYGLDEQERNFIRTKVKEMA